MMKDENDHPLENEPLRRHDLVELGTRPIMTEIQEAKLEILQRIAEVEEMLGMLLRQKARELRAKGDGNASQTGD